MRRPEERARGHERLTRAKAVSSINLQSNTTQDVDPGPIVVRPKDGESCLTANRKTANSEKQQQHTRTPDQQSRRQTRSITKARGRSGRKLRWETEASSQSGESGIASVSVAIPRR